MTRGLKMIIFLLISNTFLTCTWYGHLLLSIHASNRAFM